jgi:tetratricopeptide (TPR) repeat protein
MNFFTKFIQAFFYLSFILFVGAYNNKVSAQSHFSKEITSSFEKIYNYQFQSVDSTINIELKKNVEFSEWSLLKVNVVWWQIISGYHTNKYWNKLFISQIENTLNSIGKSNLEIDKNRYYFIILYAFRTRYDVFNDKYFSAITHLNSCINHIKKTFDKEDQYEPYYLTSGLYYYFMEKSWEDYPLLRPYLKIYPKGNKIKGLSFLFKIANSKDVFLKSEANYFLMRIFYDVEKQYDKAEFHAEYLLKLYPENIIYRYYLINILEDSGKDAEMKKEVINYKKYLEKNTELSVAQKKHYLEILSKKGL